MRVQPDRVWHREEVAASGDIGQRIATYRKRRGLSQVALANLVGRSESWLSQVERGLRPVDRMSVVLDLARILDVPPDELVGRPWQFAPNGGDVADGLADLRKVFTRYDALLGEPPQRSLDLRQLDQRVAAAHRTYQAADYEQVMDTLPDLLLQAEHFLRAATPSERRPAQEAYVSAYVVAAKLVTKLGIGDLAMLAADRAAHEALVSGSLEAQGMAAYQVACALLRSDLTDDAEQLALAFAERFEGLAEESPTLVSLAGALWLISAITAARRADRGSAWDRLGRAERLADRLGGDGNHGWTAFGPTNVAIHRVSVAAELGDVGDAIHAAEMVNPDRLPTELASRRAQVHLDLAWAHAQRRRDADATLHLLEAERIAPEIIRHNVVAQELVRSMMARSTKSKTRALTDLSRRAGLLH